MLIDGVGLRQVVTATPTLLESRYTRTPRLWPGDPGCVIKDRGIICMIINASPTGYLFDTPLSDLLQLLEKWRV